MTARARFACDVDCAPGMGPNVCVVKVEIGAEIVARLAAADMASIFAAAVVCVE